MPKTILDYSKTIMYKIVCNDLSVKECYVGHTTDMTKRKSCHKSVCHNEKNKHHNLKIYKIIRENGGWENWTMLLVEKFPCEDKYQACRRERELYEELDTKLNTLRPHITQEETKQHNKQYREEHKEYYKQYDKQYREEHKEYYKQYDKQYREEHKAEIEQYKKQHNKQYRQEHNEKIKQNDKKYREEHKEEIAEKKKEKVECKYCAKLLSKCSMSYHIKICKSK